MYMSISLISRYLLFEGVKEREERDCGKVTQAHPLAQSEEAEAVGEEEEEGLLEVEGAQRQAELAITGGIGLQMPLQTDRDNIR
jgi:hypothetical protein